MLFYWANLLYTVKGASHHPKTSLKSVIIELARPSGVVWCMYQKHPSSLTVTSSSTNCDHGVCRRKSALHTDCTQPSRFTMPFLVACPDPHQQTVYIIYMGNLLFIIFIWIHFTSSVPLENPNTTSLPINLQTNPKTILAIYYSLFILSLPDLAM